MSKKKKIFVEEFHLHQHQPDKAQFVVHDLQGYLSNHGAGTTSPHIHSYYQIIWFQRGSGTHFIDFLGHQVKDSTLFFIAKNQVHYFDGNLDCEGYLLHFNESFLTNGDEYDAFLKYNLFHNPYQPPYSRIGVGCHDRLEQTIIQIQTEASAQGDFGKDELLRAYLKAFLILAHRCKSGTNAQASFSLDDKRIQLMKFVNLLEQHFTQHYSVSEYASFLNRSSRTLSDLTAQQLSKTPSQMIQERVVLEAQRMLVHSSSNINQISYQLGFEDPSYFVKYFKKHTRLSPSDFRKAIT